MPTKENLIAIIRELMDEYKKHKKDVKSELDKVSIKLSSIDSELAFASTINDEEEIAEIKTRMKALEEKKQGVISDDLLYEQKIENFKMMATAYAKKRIEEAPEAEIDLYKADELTVLSVNADAKNEEIGKYKEQYEMLESAKKVDLATTEDLELKNSIDKIKKKYMAGMATEEDLANAKRMSSQRKEIKTTAEVRAQEQEKAINYQQEEIREKLNEIEADLEQVSNKINDLNITSIDEYRKGIIDKMVESVSKKEDLNDSYTMNKKKAFLRIASDKDLRYKTEVLLRKLSKLNHFEHFSVTVPNNYLSYVKDSEQNSSYSVDLSNVEKRNELRETLFDNLKDLNKIEELRTTDINTIPTLAWAKENGWLAVPINLSFYSNNDILGANFMPSSVIRAKSLNLTELQRKLIIDTDTKYEIEKQKKDIETDLWVELGIFIAKQISLIYLNNHRIWPSKVQNSIVLQREFDAILEKNAICKRECESLINEIDTFVENSDMEKEEQNRLEREIASNLGIDANIVKELIKKEELTEETISKENFTIRNGLFNQVEEKHDKFKLEDYEDYYDDLDTDFNLEELEDDDIYELNRNLDEEPSRVA